MANSKDINNGFQWQIDRFADIRIMRYQVPNWDELTVKQKKLIFYLSEAAACGRDILLDQNYKHNLAIKRCLEAIFKGYNGDKFSKQWEEFVVYLKRFWFSNGIHHHASTHKFFPTFTEEYFVQLVKGTPVKFLPEKLKSHKRVIEKLTPLLFNQNVASKRVSQEMGVDLVKSSANNYYEGVTQTEVEAYYANIINKDEKQPISHGLNSKLIKENNIISEQVWRKGGMYSKAIGRIVYWLEKSEKVAENEQQRKVIKTLVNFYKTGNLKTFDRYNVLWLNDINSTIDFINGFIEVYGDSMGYKGSWEALVSVTDNEASKRTQILSGNAQWFEDNSPINNNFKKTKVTGVSAKVINVVTSGGDCYPAIPLGINLPNSDWIRAAHGSKSVTIENVAYAHHQASLGSGFIEEFAWDQKEIELHEEYGFEAGNLHTDLHECLGHGSGKLAPNVKGDELKQYGSVIEETRADLFALYYIMDPKLRELGVVRDENVAKAEYNQYIRNGLLTQLTRIELGKNLEQAHMRNRQLVASWCYEHGKKENIIERRTKDNKTYFVINDYSKLRNLFGKLLSIIQEIKSTGNYQSAKELVEQYAVKIDKQIHAEVLERFKKLNIAPYGGFVNPLLTPCFHKGKIFDVKLDYSESYLEQMVRLSENYSFLPTYS